MEHVKVRIVETASWTKESVSGRLAKPGKVGLRMQSHKAFHAHTFKDGIYQVGPSRQKGIACEAWRRDLGPRLLQFGILRVSGRVCDSVFGRVFHW